MARKTFNVSELVDLVNGICKDSDATRADVRQGAMNVLEQVLHQSGNYSGFRYLWADEIANGAPGVNYIVNDNGVQVPHPDYEKRFANTDRTRVMYF